MTARPAAREDRALRRLAGAGGALAPLDPAGAVYGVFAEGDRRRRPLARLPRAAVARLVSDGALTAQGPRDYVLTEAGRARAQRAARPANGFADQHRHYAQRTVVTDDAAVETVAVTLHESPLARLMRRGPDGAPFLAPREFAAGERLQEDHERAQRPARVTMAWDAPPLSGGRRGPSAPPIAEHDGARAARRRVAAALAAVGTGLDQVLKAVCCDGRGLAEVERRLGWPKRTAKVTLKLALARLADHYGLADPAPPAGRAARG